MPSTESSTEMVVPEAKISKLSQAIQSLLIVAVAFTPLFFSPLSSELFEFPKMILVYTLALLGAGLTCLKCYHQKTLLLPRQLVNWPIALLLAITILSTIVSLNPYTSIVGYYTRFNGGLASLVAYIILFYVAIIHLHQSGSSTDPQSAINNRDRTAEVVAISNSQSRSSNTASLINDNHPKNSSTDSTSQLISQLSNPSVQQLLWAWIFSGAIVSLWGILEHFGHDPSCYLLRGSFSANCWVQDVSARVFATFGQPNWLAAYLLTIIPIAIALLCLQQQRLIKAICLVIAVLSYSAFWFTYSRAGWFGLIAVLIVLALGLSWSALKHNKFWLISLVASCVLISAFSFNAAALRAETSLAGQGDDSSSGAIRLQVWQGATQDILAHPLLGTGPGTFAYSFLPYRPRAMNDTTEWNFLYNLAHNEVLNTAATIGIPGVLVWLSLFVIVSWTLWQQKACVNLILLIRKIQSRWRIVHLSLLTQTAVSSETPSLVQNQLILLALASGIIGVFVAQLFGFSVVVTNLYFWLALALLSLPHAKLKTIPLPPLQLPLFKFELPLIIYFILPVLILVLASFALFSYTSAEIVATQADTFTAIGDTTAAYHQYQLATRQNPWEPTYHLKLASLETSFAASSKDWLPLAAAQAEQAGQLNPYNLLTFKSLTYLYQSMANLNANFQTQALVAAHQATHLAPSDADALQTLADLELNYHLLPQAKRDYQKLLQLRPHAADSYLHLAKYDHLYGSPDQYRQDLTTALRLDPHNQDAQSQLELLTTSHLPGDEVSQ